MTLWELNTGEELVPAVRNIGGNVLTRLVRHWRHRMRVAATRAELSGLPDELLRDVGVSRSDLHYIAEISADDDK